MKVSDILLALVPPFDHADEKMRNWQVSVAAFLYAMVFFAGWSFGLMPAQFGSGYALADDMNNKFIAQQTSFAIIQQSMTDMRKELISAKLHDKEIERCRVLAAASRDIPADIRQNAVDTLNGFLNDKAEEYRKITGNNYTFQSCQLLLISAGD